MKIEYRTKKLEKQCTEFKRAQKDFGIDMASKISQRINELMAATSVDMMVQFSIGRCHGLTGNRKGEYALDLTQPYRLVFKVVEQDIEVIDVVFITSIEDYH